MVCLLGLQYSVSVLLCAGSPSVHWMYHELTKKAGEGDNSGIGGGSGGGGGGGGGEGEEERKWSQLLWQRMTAHTQHIDTTIHTLCVD